MSSPTKDVVCLGCKKIINEKSIFMHVAHSKKCKAGYSNEKYKELQLLSSKQRKNEKIKSGPLSTPKESKSSIQKADPNDLETCIGCSKKFHKRTILIHIAKNCIDAYGQELYCKMKEANKKESGKRYNNANADRIRKSKAIYNAENAAKIRERQAIYDVANEDRIQERKAIYSAENKESIQERQAIYHAENADRIRERQAIYNAENADRTQERQAVYNAKKREDIKAWQIAYNNRNDA